jgi:hypothetical protein
VNKPLKITLEQGMAFLAHHPLKASFDPRLRIHMETALSGEHGRSMAVIEHIIRAFCNVRACDQVIEDFKKLEHMVNDKKTGRRIQQYDHDDPLGYRHIPDEAP